MAQETAKDAVQIYGGRGMLRSGGWRSLVETYATNAWFSQQSPKLGWADLLNITPEQSHSIRCLEEVRNPREILL